MLEENEYLGINISVKDALYLAHKAINEGKEEINMASFEQKNKESINHPDFKGPGNAIWINKKKNKEEVVMDR